MYHLPMLVKCKTYQCWSECWADLVPKKKFQSKWNTSFAKALFRTKQWELVPNQTKPNLEGGFGLNLWKGFILFQAKLGLINLGGRFGLHLWKKDFFRRSLGRYTRHGCLGSPWCGSTAQVSCWSLMFWFLHCWVFFQRHSKVHCRGI